jgi:acetyl-CoA acetyltransferase
VVWRGSPLFADSRRLCREGKRKLASLVLSGGPRLWVIRRALNWEPLVGLLRHVPRAEHVILVSHIIQNRVRPGPCPASLRRRRRASSRKRSLPSRSTVGRVLPRFETDAHNRPETTLGTLAALKPAFRPDGSITAGNAPGLNSGAEALVLADRDWAESRGLDPAARLVSYGVARRSRECSVSDSSQRCAKHSTARGWKLGDIERIEINEAFAAIAIVVMRELGLPEDIVNVEDGAIAHGHPIGSTGAVLTTRLVHSTRRDGLKRGIVALCIGGGQGIALAGSVSL